MQTPGKTPSKGNHETVYKTFKKKSDAKAYFTKIDPKNKVFKNKIYDTFYMIGEWSQEESKRVRTWFIGFFECSNCAKVLGIHDCGELHSLRFEAGKTLDFEDENARKKWEGRKWNPEAMRDHRCVFQTPTVPTDGTVLVTATPTASSSLNRLGGKKRKVSVINSKQIEDSTREEIKNSQVLFGIEFNVPFKSFDSKILYNWVNLMNQALVEMEGVETSEGLVLGHTAAQQHGLKMYDNFARCLGLLLRGEIPGYVAYFALTTDAWTSKDSKAYVDCTMRILVLHNGTWKIYAVTLALLELGLKPSQFQYDHSTREMKQKLGDFLEKLGFTS